MVASVASEAHVTGAAARPMAAFEVVDAFYAEHFAQHEGPFGAMAADQEYPPCTAATSRGGLS